MRRVTGGVLLVVLIVFAGCSDRQQTDRNQETDALKNSPRPKHEQQFAGMQPWGYRLAARK